MGAVKVAIVGVGNCAASLVQGVHYYRDADENSRSPA
jgi:myo-inositol-1-phosphate synthase